MPPRTATNTPEPQDGGIEPRQETPARPPIGPTTVDGIRAADYLKRTADALAVLAPVSAGGCGYISRDEGRRFLNRTFAGFDLPIASELMTIINGEPSPLPQETPPQVGDRVIAVDQETGEPVLFEFTETGWQEVVPDDEPPSTAPDHDEQEPQA